jgi:hypothetical protein
MPTYCHESESGDHCPEINSMTRTLSRMNSARVTENGTEVAVVNLQDAAEVLIEKGNLQKGRERCNRLRQEIQRGYGTNRNPLFLMARSERFELPTDGFEVRCSIQLSYERVKAFAGSDTTDTCRVCIRYFSPRAERKARSFCPPLWEQDILLSLLHAFGNALSYRRALPLQLHSCGRTGPTGLCQGVTGNRLHRSPLSLERRGNSPGSSFRSGSGPLPDPFRTGSRYPGDR